MASAIGRDLRTARRATGLSVEAAADRAGMSASQLGRLERGKVGAPSLDAFCRASRAVGHEASLKLYPIGPPVRDKAQLALLGRFEAVLAPPLSMIREVPLPLPGDLRAWDARISDGASTASVEGESRIEDAQALERRIALKQRDDPAAGVVLLVVNRTAHNLRVLASYREALRTRFPLDGAAVLASLRRGRVPPAGGIVLL
jgi:transcriptional regulator with XRE-family HTH domain